MSMEADLARLDERLDNVISRLDEMNRRVELLMTAHQVQTGKNLVVKTLAGSALAGLGAGALKLIEWLSYQPPPPPYHP